MGLPKSGKSASFAALANAGWRVRVLDFDGNVDPLINFTKPELRSNIEVVDCLDKITLTEVGGGSVPLDGVPKLRSSRGWSTMAKALNKWPTDETFCGDWDPLKNVLVIDSATTLASSKVHAIQLANNRDGKRKNFTDYELTQTAIEGLIQALKADVKCPVFLTAHLQLIGPDLDVGEDIENEGLRARILEEKLKGATKQPWTLGPITLGKAQVRTLAAHFSGTALCEAFPAGGRQIRLKPMDGLALGMPIPGLKESYPIETGWATILDAWRQNIGSDTPKSTSIPEKKS